MLLTLLQTDDESQQSISIPQNTKNDNGVHGENDGGLIETEKATQRKSPLKVAPPPPLPRHAYPPPSPSPPSPPPPPPPPPLRASLSSSSPFSFSSSTPGIGIHSAIDLTLWQLVETLSLGRLALSADFMFIPSRGGSDTSKEREADNPPPLGQERVDGRVVVATISSTWDLILYDLVISSFPASNSQFRGFYPLSFSIIEKVRSKWAPPSLLPCSLFTLQLWNHSSTFVTLRREEADKKESRAVLLITLVSTEELNGKSSLISPIPLSRNQQQQHPPVRTNPSSSASSSYPSTVHLKYCSLPRALSQEQSQAQRVTPPPSFWLIDDGAGDTSIILQGMPFQKSSQFFVPLGGKNVDAVASHRVCKWSLIQNPLLFSIPNIFLGSNNYSEHAAETAHQLLLLLHATLPNRSAATREHVGSKKVNFDEDEDEEGATGITHITKCNIPPNFKIDSSVELVAEYSTSVLASSFKKRNNADVLSASSAFMPSLSPSISNPASILLFLFNPTGVHSLESTLHCVLNMLNSNKHSHSSSSRDTAFAVFTNPSISSSSKYLNSLLSLAAISEAMAALDSWAKKVSSLELLEKDTERHTPENLFSAANIKREINSVETHSSQMEVTNSENSSRRIAKSFTLLGLDIWASRAVLLTQSLSSLALFSLSIASCYSNVAQQEESDHDLDIGAAYMVEADDRDNDGDSESKRIIFGTSGLGNLKTATTTSTAAKTKTEGDSDDGVNAPPPRLGAVVVALSFSSSTQDALFHALVEVPLMILLNKQGKDDILVEDLEVEDEEEENKYFAIATTSIRENANVKNLSMLPPPPRLASILTAASTPRASFWPLSRPTQVKETRSSTLLMMTSKNRKKISSSKASSKEKTFLDYGREWRGRLTASRSSGHHGVDILQHLNNGLVAMWLHDMSPLFSIIEAAASRQFSSHRDSMKVFFELVLVGKVSLLEQLARADKNIMGKQLLSLLSFDFAIEQGRNALRKNAFALMRMQRYKHAAATFLLSDPPMLREACGVLCRQLGILFLPLYKYKYKYLYVCVYLYLLINYLFWFKRRPIFGFSNGTAH